MKRFISSILSLAFLSGLFVNSSFAEELQSTEVAQEKASNMCGPESQQDSTTVTSDNASKNETAHMETVNQPANLNKDNVNKKSNREKAIETLQNNIKKYTEKQQKLIKKYENMTDKQFTWFSYAVGAAFGFLGSFVGSAIGLAISLLIDKSIVDSYNEGYEEGYAKGQENSEDPFAKRAKCNKGLPPQTKQLVVKLLALLHPDSFPKNGQGKSFNDVKEVYYNLTNFYNEYL